MLIYYSISISNTNTNSISIYREYPLNYISWSLGCTTGSKWNVKNILL